MTAVPPRRLRSHESRQSCRTTTSRASGPTAAVATKQPPPPVVSAGNLLKTPPYAPRAARTPMTDSVPPPAVARVVGRRLRIESTTPGGIEVGTPRLRRVATDESTPPFSVPLTVDFTVGDTSLRMIPEIRFSGAVERPVPTPAGNPHAS